MRKYLKTQKNSIPFPGLSSSGPTQSDSYIKGRACDGLEYLNNRSDFWRQQKPMYARKRDRQSRSAKGSANVGRGGQDPLKYVLRKLEEIDEGMLASLHWHAKFCL